MSTSLIRAVRNVLRVGPRDAFNQMQTIGDLKSGTLVGTDSYGNKYFENTEEDEIHLRTRWVQYKDRYFNMSQVEPAWHYWLGYGVDVPPNQTAKEFTTVRAYPTPIHTPTGTGTSNAFVTYNTVKPKIEAWAPSTANRG